MAVKKMSDTLRFRRSGATELSCSWCGTAVPLPAGEFSGVCIDCGTVMFRGHVTAEGSSERNHAWGQGRSLIPNPAV